MSVVLQAAVDEVAQRGSYRRGFGVRGVMVRDLRVAALSWRGMLEGL